MKKIKCVVVGCEDSGKTCLITRFLNQDLRDELSHTWLNEKDKYVTLLDENFLLNIFDTPGGDDYERIRNLIYTDVDVFVICFSVISVKSFNLVTEVWMPEIRKFQKSLKDDRKIPFLLVGLQTDLRRENVVVVNLGERSIQYLEGQDLCEYIGAYNYFECSSIKGEGIQDVFEGVINAFNNYIPKFIVDGPKKKKKKYKFKCILM